MSGSIHRPGDRIRKWLIAGFLFLSVTGSYGQDNRLSFRYDSIPFRDMIDTLEKRVPYKFYFADEWSDSLYLNVNSTEVTFEEFLNRTLGPAGFSFIITDDSKVILFKGSSVKTNFREEFIGYLERRRVKAEVQDFVPPAVKEKESTISDEYRIFRIGQPAAGQNAANAVLSGRVADTEDGRGISGVIVYIEKLKIGAMTNDDGYYSVILPRGQYQVEFRMIGMQTARRNIVLYSGGTLNIGMQESTSEVEAVVITGNRSNIVRDVRTGIEKINIKMLKQIPMGLGEADVLKSSLLLPGVQTVGEASAGFNVRGGSTDQNLVFLNNAPIINTSHFFGFFSAFNSDLVSDVTLYKSGMPAKFGGRLSSVMDIAPAEGNREK